MSPESERVSLVVCVCVCGMQRVYVELRRLTNDAHQALNGHNKLLYLLYLSGCISGCIRIWLHLPAYQLICNRFGGITQWEWEINFDKKQCSPHDLGPKKYKVN